MWCLPASEDLEMAHGRTGSDLQYARKMSEQPRIRWSLLEVNALDRIEAIYSECWQDGTTTVENVDRE